MRVYEILLEYNITSLLKTFGPILMDKWEKEGKPYANEIGEGTPEDILKWIEQYDPTQNKKYMTWILSRYAGKKGGINRLEDIPSRVATALNEYERLSRKKKLKPEHKDINQIKTIVDLTTIVGEYKDESLTSKTEVSDEVDVVFEDKDYKVIVPKSLKASCDYGNENWCTTSADMYQKYSDQGPLYIIFDKGWETKYQWHFESRQYMDEYDEPIEVKGLHNMITLNKEMTSAILKHYGGLKKAAMVDPLTWFRYIKNPSEEIKRAIVKRNGQMLKYIENPSEQLKWIAIYEDPRSLAYIENPSEEMKLEAVKINGWAIRYIINPSEQVQLLAVKEDGNLIKYIENPSEQVQLLARQNQ